MGEGEDRWIKERTGGWREDRLMEKRTGKCNGRQGRYMQGIMVDGRLGLIEEGEQS